MRIGRNSFFFNAKWSEFVCCYAKWSEFVFLLMHDFRCMPTSMLVCLWEFFYSVYTSYQFVFPHISFGLSRRNAPRHVKNLRKKSVHICITGLRLCAVIKLDQCTSTKAFANV